MIHDDLAHEIRNSIGGIKLALRHCNNDCPRVFHNIEVRQEIIHHVARMERALIVYETALKNGEVFST